MAYGADVTARPALDRRKVDLVLFVRLLDSGGSQVLQNDLGEGGFVRAAFRRGPFAFRGVQRIDQFVVLIDRQDAMRRQALDGERPGDADAGLVLIGLVEEIFVIRLGRDGSVHLLLPGDACLPPCSMNIAGFGGPVIVRLTWDFPFLPGLAEGVVQFFAQRLQGLLPLLPDLVDLGVVGDGFQGDVRHALVDEALADIAVRGRFGGRALRDLGFLPLPFGAVGEQIPGIARAHDARPRQRKRDAGCVDGDPAPAPLLGDIGRGAGAAGGVQHEVAGVGGHQDAALENLSIRLHNEYLLIRECTGLCITPNGCMFRNRKICKESHICQTILGGNP